MFEIEVWIEGFEFDFDYFVVVEEYNVMVGMVKKIIFNGFDLVVFEFFEGKF